MKNFLKKIVIFLGIITMSSAIINLATPAPTYARDFMGMPSWDDGVKLDEGKDEETLKSDIAKIATNILTDITVIAAYLIVGYVIYGGYLYMFSSGNETKATDGKRTLIHAFIGLAITISAYAIFSGIRIALIGNNQLGSCSTSDCLNSGNMVVNLIQWISGMGGVVSAIFLVVGAWGYMTSANNPNKLQKAKNTILYSLIGLAIVGLAGVLTAFISGLVRDANDQPAGANPSIVREIANINKEEK